MMKRQSRLTRIVIRYILLQLPGLVLLVLVLIFIQRWVLIPAWVFWGIIILWVVKDAILFRYTWRAYDWDPKNPLIGARGIARDRLAPIGYVKVGSELWRAEVAGDSPPIESGMNVRVKAVRGFTLLVELDRERNEAGG
jgi:membrane protein implicated in regulation of membrane protease activity